MIITVVIIIVAVNGLFYAIVPPFMGGIWNEGKLFVFGKYAFLFAHGHWTTNYEQVVAHVTRLDYEEFYTYEIIDSLQKNGCTYIWITMCNSGDYRFMSYDKIRQEAKLWPREVSRPEKGKVIPLFLGWLFRYTNGKAEKIDTTAVEAPSDIDIFVFPELSEIKDGGDLQIHLAYIQDKAEANVNDLFYPDSVTLDDKNLKYEVPKILYDKFKTASQEKIQAEVNRKTLLRGGKIWKRGKSFEFVVSIRPAIIW